MIVGNATSDACRNIDTVSETEHRKNSQFRRVTLYTALHCIVHGVDYIKVNQQIEMSRGELSVCSSIVSLHTIATEMFGWLAAFPLAYSLI